MTLERLRNLAAAALLAGAAGLAAGAPADQAVLGAFDAYRAGDALRFARHAREIGESSLLAPWIDYWRLAMRLDDASNAEVREFLEAHRDTYVAELLRGDWLKVLGRRGDWPEFEREAARYPREDADVRCFAWLARAQLGDETVYAEARSAWLEPAELPEGCARLADQMFGDARLTTTDIWDRVRALFERGQIASAKATLGYLSRSEAPEERLLTDAARQPKRLLERLPRDLEKSRPTREAVVLAVLRLARSDPAGAAQALERISPQLPEADARYLWGRIGYEGAREHEPEALAWFERGERSRFDPAQHAWQARAGLRAGDWQVVRRAIDAMPADMRGEAAWIYWYARALAGLGEQDASRAYFLRIAGRSDFYGLLASEELGYLETLPENAHVPPEEQVEAAGRNPALARALELIRLGIRTEGVREWQFATRELDDARLLAAAEVARRAGVWDRSIQAADRTVRSHNFGLRYPQPYREVFSETARAYDVDMAWVLGLVRQESRFISDARSAAGAAGLMQVMPRTATFVARKMGMRDYRRKDVTEVETNVALGTGYLRLVLDQLGHPVLASAAYNAGPARARRWRDAERPLEGAIYIETIPFPETRDYVRKVMANTMFYAALMGQKPSPLKDRLGTIAARSANEPVVEELP
jgi:soluble lytic murein transglycosylase